MAILRKSWLPLATTLVSLWLSHQAEAAGLLSLPFCVANCVQKSSTCRATDTRCICRAAREEESFLPAVAVCIRDECESSLSLGTLLIPLRTSCLVLGLPIPNSAIRNGNAALKGPVSSATASSSSAATSTATQRSGGSPTTLSSRPTSSSTSAVPQPTPSATSATSVASTATTPETSASTTTAIISVPSEGTTPGTSLTTSASPTITSSPVVDGNKDDPESSGLPTDPFAAPVERGASSREGRQAPSFAISATLSTVAILLLSLVWS
ncbi:uncharacterized protein PG998_001904 [Apiospora kogelbergensis]|uniref:CFEM domain-containing protein n=1 Tax=Apiospora kogelbergensis TaxID=1337665 RepID=A0AAW0Q442_9PEZI